VAHRVPPAATVATAAAAQPLSSRLDAASKANKDVRRGIFTVPLCIAEPAL
jgi:hypothetical protein